MDAERAGGGEDGARAAAPQADGADLGLAPGPGRGEVDLAPAGREGEPAQRLELALEGLYLARRISKDTDGAQTVYG